MAGNDLIDAWRVKHPDRKLFTWMKAGPDGVSAARLDRVYILSHHRNRLVKASMSPVGFSDHQLMQCQLSFNPNPGGSAIAILEI